MNNDSDDLEVRVVNIPPYVGFRYQGISDVGYPLVTPQVDCAQLDGDDPNTSHADAGIISEPQVDKLSAESIGQVNGLIRRLLDLGPPVKNLPAKLCK